MFKSTEYRDINDRLAERPGDLARHLLGAPTSTSADQLRFGNRGSLAVHVGGPRRGTFKNFEGGAFGDTLELVAHVLRLPMREALTWAVAWLGDGEAKDCPRRPQRRVAPPGRQETASTPRSTLALAQRLWSEAAPARNTLAEAYLASRGLLLPDDAPLRFHPECWRNRGHGPRAPAMLALMTDPSSAEPVGTHITYLRPDGHGKAGGPSTRIMLGGAGVVRLVDDADVTQGLGIAEGIETAFSVAQEFGFAPVWAAASADMLARFPVLAGLEALTLWCDADTAGERAATACAERWADSGVGVVIKRPPAGLDFNDVLGGRAA